LFALTMDARSDSFTSPQIGHADTFVAQTVGGVTIDRVERGR
jgi:hypothetical protein